MNTINADRNTEIPKNYTGVINWWNRSQTWMRNGLTHREDGPAYIEYKRYSDWYLEGVRIWHSRWSKVDLRKATIISQEQHPQYPIIQVIKYTLDGLDQELILIPGMEEFFIK